VPAKAESGKREDPLRDPRFQPRHPSNDPLADDRFGVVITLHPHSVFSSFAACSFIITML
jgi:hypothetical protein